MALSAPAVPLTLKRRLRQLLNNGKHFRLSGTAVPNMHQMKYARWWGISDALWNRGTPPRAETMAA